MFILFCSGNLNLFTGAGATNAGSIVISAGTRYFDFPCDFDFHHFDFALCNRPVIEV